MTTKPMLATDPITDYARAARFDVAPLVTADDKPNGEVELFAGDEQVTERLREFATEVRAACVRTLRQAGREFTDAVKGATDEEIIREANGLEHAFNMAADELERAYGTAGVGGRDA